MVYMVSDANLATALAGWGPYYALGCAAGVCWTGKALDEPTKFWPAFGLAIVPALCPFVVAEYVDDREFGAPTIAGCVVAVLGSPILAAVGANLCRRGTTDGLGSRLRFVPELRACSNYPPELASSGPDISAGLGLRLSF
jgi:hypothetical protein